MNKLIKRKRVMKKELIIGVAGFMLLLLAFTFDDLQQSSPLALVILTAGGLLFSIRYRMLGSALLCFSGLALAVHPLMFSSSCWLLPGALLTGYTGFTGLINWWQNDK